MSVELIAEVSTNHGGDLSLAKEFVHAFAEAGADWVKFQTTRVRHLRPLDPQYDWFAQAELSDDAHAELIEYCAKVGTRFLTTIFHEDEIALVQSLGLKTIKIGSGEAGDPRFMRAIDNAGFSRVIASDGLGDPRGLHIDRLRCVTRYPAPHGLVPDVFGVMEKYQGWSDHCRGNESCEVAIIRGAQIIEKHVYLPHQARAVRPFEASVDDFRALRAFADDNPDRFLGRWRAA
jgi:N,N'-diacetyllegionaminate synthase